MWIRLLSQASYLWNRLCIFAFGFVVLYWVLTISLDLYFFFSYFVFYPEIIISVASESVILVNISLEKSI